MHISMEDDTCYVTCYYYISKNVAFKNLQAVSIVPMYVLFDI